MGSCIPYGKYYGPGGLWCPYLPDSPNNMGEMGDELPRAPSSLSQQSDSEGSTSSLELGTGVAGMVLNTNNSTTSNIKCRWKGCGLWFTHLDHLASHVTRVHATSGQGGLFYCGWEGCSRGDRGFNARYKMLVHVRTHTNEKPHHCFKCDKSFSRAENLKIHARSHTGERPYICPIPGCGKAYSNSSDRFKHTRTHSVDKPYVCKVPGCPKRYTDPSSLRKHVKTYRHFPAEDRQEELPPKDLVNNNSEDENDKLAKQNRLNREPSPTKNLKRDCTGALKSGGNHAYLQQFTEHDSCDRDNLINGSQHPELYINGHGAQYDLFRSWLNADLAALTRSFPLGLSLWNRPRLQMQSDNFSDYPLPQSLYNEKTIRDNLIDSVTSHDSSDTLDDQDLPLDLTIHRASART